MQNQTKGQVEDLLAKEFTVFYANKLKMGPRETKVYIVDDMVILRIQKEPHPYEEALLETGDKGIEIVKKMRKHIHESIIDKTSKIITDNTGCMVISFHSDSSTLTGERFEIFILDKNLESQFTK